MQKVKVLFVCMGNICRSPTAEGVFRHVVNQANLGHLIEIDSAGTHAYHVGEPPDTRAQSSALRRGIDLSTQRARRVAGEDFRVFDYVLAMDRDNLQSLSQYERPDTTAVLKLFLEFAENLNEKEVPDPYYGGAKGFEYVLDLVEAASHGLLAHIKLHHLK